MDNSKPKRIGIEEVVTRVNKKKSTIYARMKLNKFPQRNQDGWLEEDIDYYVLYGACRPVSAANDSQHHAAA
jgi:predicted DNA-binding transcriptional regulator AlpA